ncbi:MAG: helix-turn-helix transcriptional regulator [Desulfobaccales bacterium]
MQEPMKEHHIDAGAVELKFWGPSAKKEEAIQALQSLGFVNLAEALPWRQAFPEYDPKSLPGVVLAGARGKAGITQRELSRRAGIPQRHISEMERSKRPIGKEMAKKLGKALAIDYRVFL